MFEVIMANDVLKGVTETKPQMQEAQRTQRKKIFWGKNSNNNA